MSAQADLFVIKRRSRAMAGEW